MRPKIEPVIRKPVNLVTCYWDDMERFLLDAEQVDNEYQTYISNLSPEEHALPKFNTWGCRYTILSACLYLEAFINLEYFNYIHPSVSPRDLNPSQVATLDKAMFETNFGDKWSKWIGDITGSNSSLKGKREHQELMKLVRWRNQLTHYKIQHMVLIHDKVETIENAREAKRIAVQSTKWYYDLTKSTPPDWILRDVLGSGRFRTRLRKKTP